MLWPPDLIRAIETATGLTIPQVFADGINGYRSPERLAQLGLFLKPEMVSGWAGMPPWGPDGFLPFLGSQCNVFWVGTRGPFTGVIAADGVILRDDNGGLTHAGIAGFLDMLDRTVDHEDHDSIELFAGPAYYDVIIDPGIVAAADAIVEASAVEPCDRALRYQSAASAGLSIKLLAHHNFHVAEAAAWRLGRLRTKAAIPALTALANRVVPHGRVDQHIRAAQRALKRIESP